MKILQVITSLRIGGAEKLVTEMAQIMKTRGYKIDILVFDGVETFLKEELQEKGFTVYSFGKDCFVYNPWFIIKLSSIIRKYDIVHTHNTACQYFVAMAKVITCCSNTRFVTTEHSANNRRRKIPFFRSIDRWMYRRYNCIISIADKTTENLRQFLGDTYVIRTIYNGVNVELFASAEPVDRKNLPEISDTDVVISMVAGFREEKDQDTLIRAMALLPSKFKLILVGDGVRRKELEQLTCSMSLEKRIRFLGIRYDIPQILKASDIIVMSSHWEGLSLSSLEGMSAGKPFVASDVDGLHDTVSGYGILFKHRNHEELSDILMHLIDDESYYDQVSEKCRKRALDFDIRKTIDKYLEVYSGLFK